MRAKAMTELSTVPSKSDPQISGRTKNCPSLALRFFLIKKKGPCFKGFLGARPGWGPLSQGWIDRVHVRYIYPKEKGFVGIYHSSLFCAFFPPILHLLCLGDFEMRGFFFVHFFLSI